MSACAFAGTHFSDYGYSICKLRHEHSTDDMGDSIENREESLVFMQRDHFFPAPGIHRE